MVLIVINTYASALYAYFGVLPFIQSATIKAVSISDVQVLQPIFPIPSLNFVDSLYFVIAGVIVSLIVRFFLSDIKEKTCKRAATIAFFIIQKLFLPLMPLFICGMILKQKMEGTMGLLLKDYVFICSIILFLQHSYILMMYALASNFNFHSMLKRLRNVMPAGLMAFTTASSLAALPLSLEAADKNTNNSPISNIVSSLTVNFHLVGDSFSTPILALSTLVAFNASLPSLSTYCVFIFYLMIGRLAGAGIPGGTLLITISVLENKLGFNPEMMGLILAIEFLLDPFTTLGNVLGNGAFVIIYNKLFQNPFFQVIFARI